MEGPVLSRTPSSAASAACNSLSGLACLNFTSFYRHHLLRTVSDLSFAPNSLSTKTLSTAISYGKRLRQWRATSSSRPDSDTLPEEVKSGIDAERTENNTETSPIASGLKKEISQVVRKTAGTFAPRSSTRSKNPAVPGTVLYTVFGVQAYLSMVFGGLLSYNLVFPSNDPDIWRLMGMWSIWMFSIPSLRARECSYKEKEALNYLFLCIPIINVSLPIFWKSFAAIWTADVIAFLIIYAWKLEWLSRDGKADD